MPKYVNQRELEEDAEFERELLDRQVIDESDGEVVTPKTVVEKPKDEEVDWKSRYAELRRHQQQEKDRLEREKTQLLRELEGIRTGAIKPPKTQEEINEWKETYPEFADVLDAWIKKAVDSATADLRREKAKSEKEKALLRLKEKHPDCESILSDQEFHNWLADQPKLARETIYNSFDVKAASFVIDRYKSELGITKSSDGVRDEDEFRSAAKSVKIKNKPSVNDELEDGFEFSESQIERETQRDPKWWDANEDKIMDAHRRRKIKLDLSGGAS